MVGPGWPFGFALKPYSCSQRKHPGKNLRYRLIKKQRHFIFYYIIWAPYIFTYQVTNRFLLFAPVSFELSWLDKNLPFFSFLIPIYVSYLLYAFVVVARAKDDWELNDLFYMTHFQLIVCVAFFVLFPVTFPRHEYYVQAPVTGVFLDFWTWFDAPNNCFPSLHTANCALAIHYSADKPYNWFFCTWGVLIIATTVLCKQHYAVDVAAGLAVYLASIRLRDWVLIPWRKAAQAAI